MHFSLNFQSREPIYTQLVEQVKQLVATGALKPGAQLPTVRQLAADLRVNFNTIARAYRILHDEGVISTQQGRGTFILEQPLPASSEQRKLRRAKLLELTERFLEEAERLGYTPEEIRKGIESTFTARAE